MMATKNLWFNGGIAEHPRASAVHRPGACRVDPALSAVAARGSGVAVSPQVKQCWCPNPEAI